MKKLEQASVGQFLARFYGFYDGVVREITMNFESQAPACEVVVNAQDTESASGWSRVVMQVRGCSEFRLEVGRTTFEVLSSGLQVAWDRGQVFLILDAYPDDEGLPDTQTNCGYVAGADIFWSAAPVNAEL
jgi:hypothetical protein